MPEVRFRQISGDEAWIGRWLHRRIRIWPAFAVSGLRRNEHRTWHNLLRRRGRRRRINIDMKIDETQLAKEKFLWSSVAAIRL
jgi:hypothetical protein